MLSGVSLEVAAASSWRSSGRTAPARPRCSRRSPASCRRPPARSASTGATCAAVAPARARASRHRPRAGGPPGVRLADGDGEPRDGRLYAQRPAARWKRNLERILDGCCRSWPSAATSSPARSRAASSRCWRSAAGSLASPKLLMLDEPSMGLAPTIARFHLRAADRRSRATRLTILLVEQRVAEALDLARPRLRAGDRPRGARGHARRADGGRPRPPGVSGNVKHIRPQGEARPRRKRTMKRDDAPRDASRRSLLLAALAIGVSARRGAQAKEVKVGLIAPLSGLWARQGQVMRMGAEMAIEDINARRRHQGAGRRQAQAGRARHRRHDREGEERGAAHGRAGDRPGRRRPAPIWLASRSRSPR